MPYMADKVKFTFNNKQLEAEAGQSVLEAVKQAGFEIPHYCYCPQLSIAGSCRLCAVEVGYRDKNGHVQMMAPLVMSCQTPVREGMLVLSETEKVRRHRREVMELLLINHPLDCPVCDQAGECFLQDYSFRYGPSVSRFQADLKNKQPKKQIGKNLLLYSDRCILCSRCVRFTREISGGAELAVFNRGNQSEIDIFPGWAVNDKLAGNIVDICPVGAMLDKQFLFKQRVWFLQPVESICPRCSRGCNIFLCTNKGIIWRLRPRRNDLVNGPWMCDEGRYGYKFVQAQERLNSCQVRQDGQMRQVEAKTAREQAGKLLEPYFNEHSALQAAVVISPAASCEEQFLLARWIRSRSEKVNLVMGPVFSNEKDEIFKGGFTVSAEKVPNQRGAAEVLKHFGGAQMSFKKLADAVAEGKIEALWLQGGYPWLDWCGPEAAQKLRQAKVLIVEDILGGSLTKSADVVLAGAAWAEKRGCFINDQNICQEFNKSLEPPGASVDDIQMLGRLIDKRKGLSLEQIRRGMSDFIDLPARQEPAAELHN